MLIELHYSKKIKCLEKLKVKIFLGSACFSFWNVTFLPVKCIQPPTQGGAEGVERTDSTV